MCTPISILCVSIYVICKYNPPVQNLDSVEFDLVYLFHNSLLNFYQDEVLITTKKYVAFSYIVTVQLSVMYSACYWPHFFSLHLSSLNCVTPVTDLEY